MATDPYAALGIKKTATEAEIKKAYRKIARTSHPDLAPGDAEAEARFKAASAAYDLLKDPETRARFDRGEIDETGAEQAPRGFYRDHAGARGNPYQGQGGFRPDVDPADIFAEFLRQRGGGGAQGGGFGFRGTDMRYALTVPFLDAVRGGTTRITLPEGGRLDVRIPEGTADGQTLRLRGKGATVAGGKPGDALITISVAPHKHFRREGDDILLTLPITLDEAILGAKVAAPTIGGMVNVTIPKGASSGQTLRLRGRGVRPAGAAKAGDQRIELRIVSPPKVDTELEEFLRGWRTRHAYDPRKGMKP
ncbi:MAG: DnaJ domain-containing protein [Limimaricola sp.]|uniref:DnaJ C-terminal domain-containing protein n=1 Tax=Limimaricola sp. TaxID=2211665 RepID=UPI001D9E60DE|nr:DnaJ C-terminal domain-containing protein [Limimaricola sp.]MBI1417557.1 DnaJ domain-containing protein [Limimaricola sp.]